MKLQLETKCRNEQEIKGRHELKLEDRNENENGIKSRKRNWNLKQKTKMEFYVNSTMREQ